MLLGNSIYGVIGISMGLIFWTFPHALMILTTSLRTSDARLYEAARALKTSPIKTFFMVTLPAAKYGLISTLIVVFTLVITDFGVPKVIGGSYNVLATDIFKQVVGQQNFAMGAVTSIMLLFPAVMAFGADRWYRKTKELIRHTFSALSAKTQQSARQHLFGLLQHHFYRSVGGFGYGGVWLVSYILALEQSADAKQLQLCRNEHLRLEPILQLTNTGWLDGSYWYSHHLCRCLLH